MSKVDVLGVYIDAIRLEDMLERFREVVSNDRRALVAHANVMGVNLAYDREWFRIFLNSVDLLICDGMGVKLGARMLGYHIPERFTHADWTWQLAKFGAQHGFSFYFLGNPPGVAEKAVIRLHERFPDLNIVGVQHGFFKKSPGNAENKAVLDHINRVKPDILMVGFGMPLQEKWLQENWPRLQVKIAITCGAVFEYLSGDLKRGPDWMTQHYMEWLARVLISPRRYAKRYLRDIPLFTYRILRQMFSDTVAKHHSA